MEHTGAAQTLAVETKPMGVVARIKRLALTTDNKVFVDVGLVTGLELVTLDTDWKHIWAQRHVWKNEV